MKLPILTALLLTSLPSTQAWGSLGHTTVAYVAANFVSPRTEAFFQTLLDDKTSSYLARVATWADSFRYTEGGRFSAPYHFIASKDKPPSSCGVRFDRDCGAKSCVVGAIANYTRRIVDPSLSSAERNVAAKFLIHFVGDLHQPLHDENINVGGNSIAVNFNGKATNLHSVWDSSISEKLVGGYGLRLAQQWANTLTVAIKTGVYKKKAPGWLKGMALGDPVTTTLAWAEEANTFICTTVLPQGAEGVSGKELSGAYYESAVPVVQLQVARAGYRLAAWLDLIVASIKTEL